MNTYYSLARAVSFSSDLGANVGQFTEETNKRFGCICYAVVPIPERR